MSRIVRTLIPLALAATAALTAMPSAQAAPAATSELQLVGVGVQVGMAHAIRHADGTWQKFGDVGAAAGRTDSGLITAASE